MSRVLISNMKKGSILSANVYSPLGGLLLEKGTKIFDREYEILTAFQVDEVEVEEGEASDEGFAPTLFSESGKRAKYPEEKAVPTPEESSSARRAAGVLSEPITFEQQFIKAVEEFRQLYFSVLGGLPVTVEGIKNSLQDLLRFPSNPEHIIVTLKPIFSKEDYIYYHSIAVSYISASIARWAKLPEEDLIWIAVAGALHDIGKAKLNQTTLAKPRSLTDEEMKEVKKYPVLGYHLVKGIPTLNRSVTLGILQHQEREDASGFPLALSGDSIHPYAKIIAIADIFHAMCSNKTYRGAKSPYLALEQLLADSFGKLDPNFVRIFVDGMTHFPLGTKVELNNGTMGTIVFVDSSQPTRPMVDVNGTILNLAQNRSLLINRVLI